MKNHENLVPDFKFTHKIDAQQTYTIFALTAAKSDNTLLQWPQTTLQRALCEFEPVDWTDVYSPRETLNYGNETAKAWKCEAAGQWFQRHFSAVYSSRGHCQWCFIYKRHYFSDH